MLHGSNSVWENLDLFLPFVHFKGFSCSTLDPRIKSGTRNMTLSGKRGACYLHFTNVEAEVWIGDMGSPCWSPAPARPGSRGRWGWAGLPWGVAGLGWAARPHLVLGEA